MGEYRKRKRESSVSSQDSHTLERQLAKLTEQLKKRRHKTDRDRRSRQSDSIQSLPEPELDTFLAVCLGFWSD